MNLYSSGEGNGERRTQEKKAGSGLTSYALSFKERVVFTPNYVMIKTELLNCNKCKKVQ